MRAGAREAGSDSALSVTTRSPNFLTKGKLRIGDGETSWMFR